MGNLRTGARRIAAFLATLGVLVMSSGIALMVTATPASATIKVKVCHANNSDDNGNNPYNYLEVGAPAAFAAHGAIHRSGPGLKHWSSAGTWNGVWHDAGDPRPDYVAMHPWNHQISESWCENAANAPVTAEVDWTEPDCDNQNTAAWDGMGDHVTFALTDGNLAPGATVEVTATAADGYHFAGGVTTKKFDHTFDAAEDCTAYDASADVQFVDPECENENTPSYAPTGNNVTFEITDGEVAPGEWVEITATATEGHAFADESTTKVFTHTFDPEEICEIVLPPRELTPEAPTFVDPTCDADPSLALPEQGVEIPDDLVDSARAAVGPVIETADVDGIHYEASGSLVPGGTVEVVATLVDPETTVFAPEVTTAWSHTFAVPTGCTSVAPPIVDTPSVDTTTDTTSPTVVTPTVVNAGLASDVVQDARAQQGLALVLAGMVLLVCAGGLGLVRPRVGARIG